MLQACVPQASVKNRTVLTKASVRIMFFDHYYLLEGKYKLIYSYRKGIVYVHAVFDTRRDPGTLKL